LATPILINSSSKTQPLQKSQFKLVLRLFYDRTLLSKQKRFQLK